MGLILSNYSYARAFEDELMKLFSLRYTDRGFIETHNYARGTQRLLCKHRRELGIEAYKKRNEIPWIYLHNYAEWQGKANVRRSEVFQEYVKQIKEAIAKAKPIRTEHSPTYNHNRLLL